MLPVITMMLALVSLAFGILYTLATRVAFRGDPLRVLALLWADTRLFFATRDGLLVVPTARDKETTTTALLQKKKSFGSRSLLTATLWMCVSSGRRATCTL